MQYKHITKVSSAVSLMAFFKELSQCALLFSLDNSFCTYKVIFLSSSLPLKEITVQIRMIQIWKESNIKKQTFQQLICKRFKLERGFIFLKGSIRRISMDMRILFEIVQVPIKRAGIRQSSL